MYQKERYLELLDSPVLGQLFLTAISKSEEGIKELSASMGRSHRSLTSAFRAKIARKKLIPILNSTVKCNFLV